LKEKGRREKNAHERATHYKTQNDEKKKTQRMQQEIACWWMLSEEKEYMWQSRIIQWRSNKITAEDLKSLARDHMMLVDAIRREATDTNGGLYHPTFKIVGDLKHVCSSSNESQHQFSKKRFVWFFSGFTP
jgi:hypothetical protein